MSHTTIVLVDSRDGQAWAHEITAGHHHLVADEPRSNGGADEGPNPYQLLLSALGACTAITLGMYAQHKGWDLGHVRVRLDHRKDDDGRDHVERTISIGAPLTDEQRERLLDIAGKTPVTKTLRAGVDITSHLSESTE